jgi:hypothetical protein
VKDVSEKFKRIVNRYRTATILKNKRILRHENHALKKSTIDGTVSLAFHVNVAEATLAKLADI